MDVGTILSLKGRTVATVDPEATLAQASAELASKRIGALVVIGPNHSIAGILSERDIVKCVAQKGAAALNERVSAVMTRKVVTCTERDNLQTLMESMTAGKFRHLPVVDQGRLTGIISIGDVVKNRLAEMEQESENLRSYIMSA